MMTKQELTTIVSTHITPLTWKTPDKSIGWVNRLVFDGERINQHSTFITLGIGLENVVKDLLREKYSSDSVKSEIMGCGVENISLDDARNEMQTPEAKSILKKLLGKKKSIVNMSKIYTRLPVGNIMSKLTGMLETKKREGKSRIPWSQEDLLKETNVILNEYISQPLQNNPILCVIADIILYQATDGTWYIIEVKLSGDCDSQKTVSVIAFSLLLPFICLGNVSKKVVIGIVQDTKGKKKRDGLWKGPFATYIDESVYLLEEKFGNFFLPNGVNWNDFKETIRIAMGNNHNNLLDISISYAIMVDMNELEQQRINRIVESDIETRETSEKRRVASVHNYKMAKESTESLRVQKLLCAQMESQVLDCNDLLTRIYHTDGNIDDVKRMVKKYLTKYNIW